MMNQLNQLLSQLVAIDSVNPDLVPGGAGEGAVAHFIAEWLTQAGLEVTISEVQPGRPNVIGIARGTGGGFTLLLNGHIDTVGVAGMSDPHRPRIEKGRMYGRGVYDMKAGVAACMIAAVEAQKHNLAGDVIIAAVVDEEYAGLGTMAVADHLLATKTKVDAAIVAEPTEMQLVIAHKGFTWFEIETHGVAAHGSRPDLGVDAICKMGHVLVEIEKLGQRLLANPTHPLLKSGSLHGSLISGGQELSSYPERCLVSIERRMVPGETPASCELEFQQILDDLQRSDPTFRASMRRGLDRTPMETSADSLIASTLRKQAAAVTKGAIEVVGVPYWTDAATLAAAGIPAVLFGPTGAGAHAVKEWVDLESVAQCAQIYLETVRKFCA